MAWKRPNRLHAVAEADASQSLAKVYTEIKEAFGVSQVPLLFQMYAANELFLAHLWEKLSPVARSAEFMAAASRLSADAYTRMHNYFEVPSSAVSPQLRREVSRAIDLFQYQDGAILLLLSMISESFDNPVGSRSAARHESPPPQLDSFPMLEEQEIPQAAKKSCEEIGREFGLGVLPMEFRVLARWPEFLNSHWQMWKQIASSPLLVACEYQVLRHSIESAQALPGPVEISTTVLGELGVSEEETAGIVRFTRAWNRAAATLLLQISTAKISVEGGSRIVSPEKEKETRKETEISTRVA